MKEFRKIIYFLKYIRFSLYFFLWKILDTIYTAFVTLKMTVSVLFSHFILFNVQERIFLIKVHQCICQQIRLNSGLNFSTTSGSGKSASAV